MKAKLEKKLHGLIHGLEEIQVEAQAFEERYEVQLRGVHPDQYKCALNLLHYLALRQHDVSVSPTRSRRACCVGVSYAFGL